MQVIEELRRLSAAEEFFAFLGVDYDPAVLRVARLHILRRMGDYLRADMPENRPDHDVRVACAVHLAQAYADFVSSSPLEQRVFKVLKEAVLPRANTKGFVALSTLRGDERT